MSSYDMKKMKSVKMKKKENDVANFKISDIVRSQFNFHYIILFTIHNSQY
jgi:hypothetical protein